MRNSSATYVFVFATFFFGSISVIAQDNEWLMTTIVTEFVPVEQKWIELCKTDTGKRMIIESFSEPTKFDFKLQYLGIRRQDSLRSLLVGQAFSSDEYKPTLDQFYLESIERDFCTPIAGGQIVNIYDPNKMIFYANGPYFCVSKNTGGSHKYDCNEKYPLMLPDGWQVCKFFYDGTTRRHGEFKFQPVYVENDSERPPRILGHTLYITGHGDVGNPSSAHIKNIKVYAIKSNLDNNYRKQCGCDMPLPEIQTLPKPKEPEKKASSTPAKISYAIMNKSKDGHSAFLVIRNEGGTSGILRFKIVYKDKYTGVWKRYQEGDIAINPNEIISNQMTVFDAVDWTFEYDKIIEIK